ncbi:hypothetical protein [Paenibacillus elgii]|uniref:hypothetical protein n=1 Tax=Paenibacillus elgii TaxID=189691 RepID=UPI0013D791FC|nr:hypothetical protein [Paenibacillus elgii]
MKVTANGVSYNVVIAHAVAEFRNSAGESRKTVFATNLETRKLHEYSTYENLVTEDDIRDFLETRTT